MSEQPSVATEATSSTQASDSLRVLVIPGHREGDVRVEAITGEPEAALERLVGVAALPILLDSFALEIIGSVRQAKTDEAEDVEINIRASVLRWVMTDGSPPPRQYFTGDVVLVGARDGRGRLTDVPPEVVETLRPDAHYIIQFRPREQPQEWVAVRPVLDDWLSSALIVIHLTGRGDIMEPVSGRHRIRSCSRSGSPPAGPGWRSAAGRH